MRANRINANVVRSGVVCGGFAPLASVYQLCDVENNTLLDVENNELFCK